MSEVNITVVGNVATEPKLDRNKNGDAFAHFRLACNSAHYDSRSRSWVDDDTSYYTVYCWRSPLADNIAVSVHKGDPVVVYGRLKNREWRDKNDAVRVSPEITARSLGHDLYRGTSTFTKVTKPPLIPDEDDAVESVRAAYVIDHDLARPVDQRTGEILSRPLPGGAASVNGHLSAGPIAGNAPAVVGDRLTAGDRMTPGDRLMGTDRSVQPAAAASAGEAGSASRSVLAAEPTSGAPGDNPPEDAPSGSRSGGRARREKAGVAS